MNKKNQSIKYLTTNFKPKSQKTIPIETKLHDLESSDDSDEDSKQIDKMSQAQKKKKLNPLPPVKLTVWQEKKETLKSASNKLTGLPFQLTYAVTPKNPGLFPGRKTEVLNLGLCICKEDGNFCYENQDGEYDVVEDEELIQDINKLIQYSNNGAKK